MTRATTWYGQVRTQEGASPTDKMFTGQQRETAGGVYHYNARMYNADVGRFPQADTVVPNATDPQALNRYAYVRNSPVMYTDPTGRLLADDQCGTRQCTPPSEYPHSGPPAPQPQPPAPVPAPTPPSHPGPQQPQTPSHASPLLPPTHVQVETVPYNCLGCIEMPVLGDESCRPMYPGQSGCVFQNGETFWEQVQAVWGVLTSECAVGIYASLVVGASVWGAAIGAGALMGAGGVVLTSAAAAGASGAALYYAAGPANVNNVINYGPRAILGVSACVE